MKIEKLASLENKKGKPSGGDGSGLGGGGYSGQSVLRTVPMSANTAPPGPVSHEVGGCSFKITGISHFEENAKIIGYDTILEMEYEPNNPYDTSAIKIKDKDKMIGYVPNSSPNIKKLCFENINEKLKVINIKDNPRGIRVLFQSLYNEDVEVVGVFGD